MAQKEGQGVGKRRFLSGMLPYIVPWDSIHTTAITLGSEWGSIQILKLAAGGGRETSLSLLHHSRDVPGIMKRNINEGWPPADDPAAGTMAPSEVRQAEMLSRYDYLCLHVERRLYIFNHWMPPTSSI